MKCSIVASLAAKPLYDFYKELPPKMEVFRTKQTILECHVNDPNAPVKWYKNGIPIDVSDKLKKKSQHYDVVTLSMQQFYHSFNLHRLEKVLEVHLNF